MLDGNLDVETKYGIMCPLCTYIPMRDEIHVREQHVSMYDGNGRKEKRIILPLDCPMCRSSIGSWIYVPLDSDPTSELYDVSGVLKLDTRGNNMKTL